MKKARKILWGLGFLSAAILLIVGNLYGVQVSDILLMLAMMAFMIEGIIHRNFILILLPAAVIFALNSKRLGIPELNTWTVLAAALFGGVGLHILFPGSRRWKKMRNTLENYEGTNGEDSGRGGKHGRSAEEIVRTSSGEEVRLENSFGETVKYLTGEMPEQVRLENSFGSMSIYFDSAVLKDHTVHVRAETSFGNIVLYIPAVWNVVIKSDTAFGNIREKGYCNPDGTDTLELRAGASFGEIEVRYI